MSRGRDGFTLLELSIVVIIVGLIVGASVFAWTLIRQGEVRSVISEVDRYTKAVGMFKVKYNALPGDMYNATDLWGVDVAAALGSGNTCNDTYSTTTPHTATCNGNGNGSIGDATPGVCSWTAHFETFRAWQHLADAVMIDGTYTGTTYSSSHVFDVKPGVNVPLSAARGGGYELLDAAGLAPACAEYFPAPAGSALYFGDRIAGTGPGAPVLTAAEAQQIDTKLDDGLPASGQVQAPMNAERIADGMSDPNCLTSDTQSSSAYNVSDTNNTCTLIFYFTP